MGRTMDEIQVDNGDISLRVEVTGEGPVVLCVHGWPELASSWHNQVRHLAERGYRAASMDVRGYGGSSAPPEIERYTLAERAVAGLSVPYTPPMAFSLLDLFDQLYADRFFYMLYFREPGVAEAAFGADLRGALKRCYFALSGERCRTGGWRMRHATPRSSRCCPTRPTGR